MLIYYFFYVSNLLFQRKIGYLWTKELRRYPENNISLLNMVCVCAGDHVCMHVKSLLSVFLIAWLPTLCFETGSLIKPGTYLFGQQTWPGSSRNLSLPSQGWDFMCAHHPTLICICILGIQMQGLRQVLYQMSSLPEHFFYILYIWPK